MHTAHQHVTVPTHRVRGRFRRRRRCLALLVLLSAHLPRWQLPFKTRRLHRLPSLVRLLGFRSATCCCSSCPVRTSVHRRTGSDISTAVIRHGEICGATWGDLQHV